jgi:hypothetical protein
MEVCLSDVLSSNNRNDTLTKDDKQTTYTPQNVNDTAGIPPQHNDNDHGTNKTINNKLCNGKIHNKKSQIINI